MVDASNVQAVGKHWRVKYQLYSRTRTLNSNRYLHPLPPSSTQLCCVWVFNASFLSAPSCIVMQSVGSSVLLYFFVVAVPPHADVPLFYSLLHRIIHFHPFPLWTFATVCTHRNGLYQPPSAFIFFFFRLFFLFRKQKSYPPCNMDVVRFVRPSNDFRRLYQRTDTHAHTGECCVAAPTPHLTGYKFIGTLTKNYVNIYTINI